MQLNDQQAQALVQRAGEALRQGQPQAASRDLRQVLASGRDHPQLWLMLAGAERALGNRGAEEDALDRALALDPRLVLAQIMKGDCRAAADDQRGALNFYEMALRLTQGHQPPAELTIHLSRAETYVASWRKQVETQREAALAAAGLDRESRSPRFEQALEILAGRKEIYVQQPTGFYFPGLPAIQFFEPTDFAWSAAVEAETDAIRTELDGLLVEMRDGFRPYLHGDPARVRVDANTGLLDSRDWSALFLCENGVPNEAAIERCPRTWAIMQQVPFPDVVNSPTVMFSLLRPGARIEPHTGMLNTRLICHLPLIVPPGCGFRVGNETREWQEGKLLIFDDTIEHEAWNKGSAERVVLIFDIWRPDLSEREKLEIGTLYTAMGNAAF
jgi:hypothetical protein